MMNKPCFEEARRRLLEAAATVGTERVPLPLCGGRVLAETLRAAENVPAFDRSPYDGYALCASDTAAATAERVVTLRIIEELPAGAVPTKAITAGTAVKVLTGAPIPQGADAVVMYEKTAFTEEYVTLYAPLRAGENIVRAGEDIRKGAVLAEAGAVIDPGLAGTLAAQGVTTPPVYRRPRVALLSTGSELVEAGDTPAAGQIRNASRSMLEAALRDLGCEAVYMGIVGDRAEDIASRLEQALSECDAVITTGGVSVGDYDLTAAAMTTVGAELLFRGVDIKPGMACACSVREGKLLCGLSGNPASALTTFYAVIQPSLKRLTGRSACLPQEVSARLLTGFEKESPHTRLLRGRLVWQEGAACIALPRQQGNVALSSAVGCDVMAVIPAGSGAVAAGTVVKGFLL